MEKLDAASSTKTQSKQRRRKRRELFVTLRKNCFRWKTGDVLRVILTNEITDRIMGVGIGKCVFFGNVSIADCSHLRVTRSDGSQVTLTGNDVDLWHIVGKCWPSAPVNPKAA